MTRSLIMQKMEIPGLVTGIGLIIGTIVILFVLHHSLVRGVIFIFTKGKVYNVAKITGPERMLAKSIVAPRDSIF